MRGSTRTRTCSTTTRGRSARRARCVCSTSRTSPFARPAGRTEDRRLALRRLRGALRAASARSSMLRRAVHDRSDARARARLLHAHDLRVHRPGREHAGSTICGGGRYDCLSRRSAARRRRASASAPASSGCCSARARRRRRRAERPLDVFLVAEDEAQRDDAARGRSPAARAQARGDTDYAGRSMKGQLTQAQKRAQRSRSAPRRLDAAPPRRGGSQRRDARGAAVSSGATRPAVRSRPPTSASG